jgi:hypothetical protein
MKNALVRSVGGRFIGVIVGLSAVSVPLAAVYADDTGSSTSATATTTASSQTAQVLLEVLSPGNTIGVGTNLSFTAVANGLNNPTFSISDSLNGSTISSSTINGLGFVSWTPMDQDVGVHTITVKASDSTGNSASGQVVVTVLSPNGTPAPTTTTTSTTSSSTTSSLSSAQVQAILSLLQSFGADQSIINNVANNLGGTAPASSASSTSHVGDNYVFNNFLDVGTTDTSSDTDVAELQQRLTDLGIYSGPITGHFGPLTEAAVKMFQSQHNLDQFGYVGPGTRAALNAYNQ